MTLEWKEPPPAKSSSANRARLWGVVAELKAQPGVWALVATESKSAAHNARGSYVRHGCEATVRRSPTTGKFDLYARWPVES